ncbi:Hypothetical predicted protein [Olea europaea subsp. europaea]|uniref:Uncharacterized protein n=1 Tax=Olea europaea subsp. europaea TaxID=158383 RepID=A0A8S0QCC9_OLEEU|nr:Hypothetical predicted protein [Olea europaea subsp. europaea]
MEGLSLLDLLPNTKMEGLSLSEDLRLLIQPKMEDLSLQPKPKMEGLSLFPSESNMEDLSYENLSRLVKSPDLLSRLLPLRLDGREKNVGFQWLGPHFFNFSQICKRSIAMLLSRTLQTTYYVRSVLSVEVS